MTIPAAVLNAYGLSADKIEEVSGGLINQTYRVRGDDGNAVAALQCLHPIFAAEVNLDLEAITGTLAAAQMPTPRLIRTSSDAAWVTASDKVWRAITWVDGQCFSELPKAAYACSAAELVGRFHCALLGSDYQFQFTRSGVHDTAAHFAKLRATERAPIERFAESAHADALREEIFAQSALLPAMPELPLRICHGDLKLSNILFDADGQGLCLIDLDTMGQQTIAYELGDALRSWGNCRGEDAEVASIRVDVVAEAARGYAQGSQGLLSEVEVRSVIIGLETICLELAARFCVDIYDDRYFGWDPASYESRRAHNLARARGQLALCKSVASERTALQSAWTRAF